MIRPGLTFGFALALALPALASAQGMMPFTTFGAETKAIASSVPCKWVSVGGKYVGGRYDFLCKGGTWATVSLFVDKAEGTTDGVGAVKLHYREWNPEVNPNAGEAMIAQQFLNLLVERFVPGRAADEVSRAFWTNGSRSWSGGGVRVGYEFEKGKDYNVRKLEVYGTGRSLVGKAGVVPKEAEKIQVKTADERKVEQARDMLRTAPVKEVEVQWQAPVTKNVTLPTPAGDSDSVTPVKELQLPKGLSEPAPQHRSVSGKVQALVEGAMGGGVSSTLEKATPAELNTAPNAASYKPVKAPPAVSSSLVPDADEIVKGREKAPSNYSAYNKAEELTKSLELRALKDSKDTENKIRTEEEMKASKAQQTLAPSPKDEKGPTLQATPTPNVEDKGAAGDASVPGDGKVIRLEREDGGWTGGLNQDAKDPFAPGAKAVRPLPQLRFVPKAEPLPTNGDVIQFEDEGSKL